MNLGLSKLLDSHEFGDFRVALAFAFFCAALVLLGGDRAAPRLLAGPLDQSEFGAAWVYLRFYGLLGLTGSGAIIAGAWSACSVFGSSWDVCNHNAIQPMTFAIPFMALGALAGRVLQTAGRTFLALYPWRVGVNVLVLVGLSLSLLITGRVGLGEAVWIAVSSVAVTALWQSYMARRRALQVVTFAAESQAAKTWLQISLPMMGAFLVTLGLAQSDFYFLEWLGSEESEVGHYAAGVTTAHLIIVFQTTVVALFAPLVAREIESGSVQTNEAMRRGERVMALAVLPILACLVLGAAPAMGIFGPEYQEAAPVLRFLALGNSAWAMAALSVLWLQYRGRGITVVVVTAATLMVDSALNILLIPVYGMLGAAGSSAATLIGAALAMVWLTRRPRRSISDHRHTPAM